MIESNNPDRATEEPSTKRTKDGPVDLHALQHSLYEPLGKTYPFFSTPVPGPPKLPQAAQDWLNQVIQQDPQTGRICYAHAPLLRPFNENHLVVLRAAFDANKDRLDALKESFFEFTSAMAGCSAAQVVSIRDKDDPSKYLANHDFYSDPNQDEAICFNVEGLTQSDAEYILAYVGHFGKRLLKAELHAALGEKSDRISNKSSKATKTSSLCEMAAKAAQGGQKSERGSLSSFKSGSQGASLPVPLRVSKDISQAEFQQHWAKGRILVFTDLQFIKRNVWSPHDLKKLSGTASVSVYDAVKQMVTMEPMTTFFDRGFVGRDSKSIRIIEAWPEKTLMEEAPRLYADLIKTLPVPMYTHPAGSYNLSKYLPSDWITQGPKLHIGEGSTDKNVGSIRLRVENSDVLYACVYAERRERAIAKGDEAVVWDIFQAEDREKVENFMRQSVGKKAAPPKRCVDPFQDIVPYLKPEVLSLLHKATGVKATRVALKVDEAIMIPAGCLRQAQFVQNAVTVEVDFVSPERLWATIDWCHEKQEYAFARPKSKTRRTDIFPAHDVAFYSSLAMAQKVE
ncbi:putative JmjC domain-containing histone demethylation protein 2C [Podila clonocystis]|nr:putative JmjC domain-containing histone demethylation protein 2C [Podila clonocystis]